MPHMSLTSILVWVFASGFAVQCLGGVIVADGHLIGLSLTVMGSITMGFALGVYKTARAIRAVASVELPSKRRGRR